MADYVVSSALETFTALLARHPEMEYGAFGLQIQNLKTELENLLPWLLSNKDFFWHSHTIGEATYKAVDVVETFCQKLIGTRLSVLVSASSIAAIPEVKEITAEISKMAEDLKRFGVKPSSMGEGDRPNKRHQKVLKTYVNFGQLQPVGLDSHVQHVSNLLLEHNPYRIIHLHGLGGMGKTTLAKLIYHNNRIRDHFQCFAWVFMSQVFVVKDLLESILIQLSSCTTELELATREMAEKIIDILRTKRCLVVLDDLREEHIFQYLLYQRISTASNSKIVVTSRTYYKYVPPFEMACSIYLNGLDEESSWGLFHSIVISKKDKTDIQDEIINLGMKIVKCCGGIPLYISLLAGLLSTKETLEEWEAVSEKVISYETKTNMDILLKLYDDLPYYLKPCLLYFVQFPKGFEISVKRLIQMWIADGVIPTTIHERDGQIETMEDVAYGYLSELVERYMVQIGKRGSNGKIKTCKMHDQLIFDLAWKMTRRENFFDKFDQRWDNVDFKYFVQAPRYSIKVMQMDSYDDIFYAKELDLMNPRYAGKSQKKILRILNTRVRSLIYDFSLSCNGNHLIKFVVKRFKFLRILCLENFKCTRGILTKHIGDLVLLKFLSLKNSNICELSSSIFLLSCLQTLDLRNSTAILKIPNLTWRTENLRHLYMHPAYILKDGGKLKLGHLSNLQTLVNINDADLQLEDVVELGSLRKLVIIIRKMQEGFVITREFEKVFKFKNNTLSRLQTLGIINMTSTDAETRPFLSRCCGLYKMQVQGKITKLSECHQLSFNLVKLIIKGTYLEEDPMATLEKLPNLYVLGFDLESFMGCYLVCSERGFPQLQFLCLHGLLKLQELAAEDGTMPLLSQLDISNCPNLKTIPEKVRLVTTFRN